ncbi:MAG: DUF427 domain-containing protein [Thermoleophilia bacterium]
MVRAMWNGAILAESDDTKVVEGNHYFPATSLATQYLVPSAKTSVCPWKGAADYYDVAVGDAINPGAAWYYPRPKPAAGEIAGHVAFWKGVQVVDDAAPARRGLFGLRR